MQEADGYDVPGESHAGTPPFQQPASPTPSDNIFNHPFFRSEFTLPQDETIDQLVSARRMRASASLPSSSPAPSPAANTKSGRGGRKGKSKLKVMAGLVGGDSDSSALTQESGDESVAPTPRDSVATGTDAGEDYAEEEEEPRQSPGTLSHISVCPILADIVHYSSLNSVEAASEGERQERIDRGSWTRRLNNQRWEEEKEVAFAATPTFRYLIHVCSLSESYRFVLILTSYPSMSRHA